MKLFGYELSALNEDVPLMELSEVSLVCTQEEIDGLIATLKQHKRKLEVWLEEKRYLYIQITDSDYTETQYRDCVSNADDQSAVVFLSKKPMPK